MPTWLKNNLGGLLRFSGRSSRAEFWPYAGVLFVVTLGLAMLAMQWSMSDFITEARRFAAEHPEMAETVEPASYAIQIGGFHPDFVPAFAKASLGTGAVALFFSVLIAAAATRRLHDRGKRGWWAALPIPFLSFGLIAMPLMIRNMSGLHRPDLTLFFAIFFNNVIYLGLLLFVVVLLAGRGMPGPNRYGDPPP